MLFRSLNSHGNRSNLNGNRFNQNHNKRKGNFNGNKNQKNHPQKKINIVYPTCSKCGKKHPGECKLGSNTCYLCGKEGHFAKSCYTNKQNQLKPQGTQLHNMQAKIEGPQISQGRLEAPPGPNAHIFAYTRNDVEVGTSNVVTGQLSVANQDTHVFI